MLNRFLVFCAFIFLVACFGDPNFSRIPEIFNATISQAEPANQTIPVDVVTLSVDFQDGDGDLGLSNADSVFSIYAPTIVDNNGDTVVNPFFNNYFINVIRRTGTTFDTIVKSTLIDLDTTNFGHDSRYPLIGDGTGAVEGRLDFDIEVFYNTSTGGGFNTPYVYLDSLIFEVQIADRALNLSNKLTSSEIVLGILD